jgi:hypothetical protein
MTELRHPVRKSFAVIIMTEELSARHATACRTLSEGCDGRRAEGKLSATATAAIPMPNEPT